MGKITYDDVADSMEFDSTGDVCKYENMRCCGGRMYDNYLSMDDLWN